MLAVRLTPRSARDSIEGVENLSDGRAVLKVRVRALPTDGEANAALARLLAKAVGVPTCNVILVAGATTRLKRLLILGNSSAIVAALERLSG